MVTSHVGLAVLPNTAGVLRGHHLSNLLAPRDRSGKWSEERKVEWKVECRVEREWSGKRGSVVSGEWGGKRVADWNGVQKVSMERRAEWGVDSGACRVECGESRGQWPER